jgi:serine/threonine protein phosphatase PrpC
MSRRHSPNEKVKPKNSPSPSNLPNEQRYCICQKREDELNDQDNNDFMIECDGCNGWFHGKCIGLADRIAGKDFSIFIFFIFLSKSNR